MAPGCHKGRRHVGQGHVGQGHASRPARAGVGSAALVERSRSSEWTVPSWLHRKLRARNSQGHQDVPIQRPAGGRRCEGIAGTATDFVLTMTQH